MNNPFHVKENDEHALGFALHLSPFFDLGEFRLFRWELTLSSPNALIIFTVSVAFFPGFSQKLMHTHCSFVESIAKSHQARYTTPNKRR
jgi:hypothetical protein